MRNNCHGASRVFFLVAFLVLALDQWSKRWIVLSLEQNQSISLGVLDIRHVHNRGAAFGILPSGGVVFVVVAFLVLGGLVLCYPRLRCAGLSTVLSLALISGGTVGNLVDRLRFGYVVDFIDLRWWPVFNVADSAICVGVGLLMWVLFQRGRADGL